MEEIKFKNLTELIDDIETEDKCKKYKITNDSLDIVIRYCYEKSISIFILEEVFEFACNEGLLKKENVEDISKDILIYVLKRKNIKFSCVEDHLIINLSNKSYLEKQYRYMYYRKRINKCEKEIKSTSIGVIVLIILSIAFKETVLKKILTMDIGIFSLIGKLSIITALLWALIYGIKLKSMFIEKRLLKKKLGLAALVDDSDFLDW